METQNDTPIKYCLYARKSSEDEYSQEKSIPDQIKYCKEMAERAGITILRIFKEARSAKISNNRPVFNEMIREVKKGTYTGIIAYHPDRLARNSLESGILIDMLDNNIIKDLKFPTCQFQNNSSGKLLLNILFAMSKQYSEHLSEVVKRGMDSNLEKGKSSGAMVWGYKRDSKTGFYEPDENFEYIKQGWEMRLAGKTQTEIAAFWKNHNIKRENLSKKAKKNFTLLHTKQQASKLFKNPIYYGVLTQSGTDRDLRIDTAFKPMVTEEEYNKIQLMNVSKRKNLRNKKRQTFYPLRHFVKCSCCGEYMVVGPSTSKSGTRYLYYRCDNKQCPKKGKSIRAKILFDGIYAELLKLKLNEELYKQYVEQISSITQEKYKKYQMEKRSLRGAIRSLDKQIQEKSMWYGNLTEKGRKMSEEAYNNALEDIENQKIDIQAQLQAIDERIIDPSKLHLSLEEFLNLAQTASDKMKAGKDVQKDMLCRKLFLNIVLDKEKGPTFLWQEPFNTLVNTRSVTSGGREGT